MSDKSLPTHKVDCICVDICKNLGVASHKCYADALTIYSRCSFEQQQNLLYQEAQKPSKLKRVASFIERGTLWLFALCGFIALLITIFFR